MKKYALITGGTKGIGKAVACLLGQAGYNLILTYSSDKDAALQTRKELLQYSSEVRLLEADICVKENIDVIGDYLTAGNLRLDALVFNAGITCRAAFEEMRLEDWEKTFFGNVHFPVFLLQRIVGLMNKGGCVVFTGSLMGIHPHSVSLAYGVTKSAVHALVKNLVKFLLPYDIRVNGVAPGFVDTDWHKGKPAAIRQSIEGKIASGRFCRPEELAEIYKMLMENSCFNGEIIVADGGYSYK
ncbi:MAG: SDR family oxidoreductase [Bacteroidales bacterium]